jgi:hypothetical protein
VDTEPTTGQLLAREVTARAAHRNLGAGASAHKRGKLGETGKAPDGGLNKATRARFTREMVTHQRKKTFAREKGTRQRPKEGSAQDGNQKDELDSCPDLADEANFRTKNSDPSVPTQKGEDHTTHTKPKVRIFHSNPKHDYNRTTEVTALPPSFNWN